MKVACALGAANIPVDELQPETFDRVKTIVSQYLPGLADAKAQVQVTQYLPEKDRHLYSKQWCRNNLVALLGGRCAEQLVLREMTTGAGNDIEMATEMARKMVCEWGMSEKLEPLTFGKKEEMVFLGKEISTHKDYSEQTAREIDAEIKTIIMEGYNKAKKILEENIDVLHKIAYALLEKEVLDGEEIDRIIREGKDSIEPVKEDSSAGAVVV